MLTHIKKLAIIQDTTTDVIVLLSNISDGVDGASTFGYSTEETALTIEDGQTVMDALEHTLDIRTIADSDEASQLESWTDNLTKVNIVGVGIDGSLLIGDGQTGEGSVRFYKDDQFDQRKAFKIFATRKTTPGFDSDTGIHENGIFAGQNLLGGYVWGDADGGGVADGWSATGFTTTSFASGVQTLEADTTARDFQRAIWFPFPGEQITFSVNNDSRSGTYATEQIEIEFVDTSGSVISSQTSTFSTTGRKSVSATVPSGSDVAKAICRFSIQASSGTVTNEVSDPSLQIGTGTTYTKY